MQQKNSAGSGLPVFNRVAEGGKRFGYLLVGLVKLAIGGALIWWSFVALRGVFTRWFLTGY